jgi:hypothetical protein
MNKIQQKKIISGYPALEGHLLQVETIKNPSTEKETY